MVTIGATVKITILSTERGVVRLGIEAPKTTPVHRKEVYDKIIEVNKKASKSELSNIKKALVKSGVHFSKSKQDKLLEKTPKISMAREII